MKSDLELIQDVKSGVKSAFETLVLRHDKFLLKVVVRMTRDLNIAEDIVQETFIKAFRRLHLFEGRSSLRSWLYQIALNTTRNRFRKVNRETLGTEGFDIAVDGQMEAQMMAGDVRSVIQREVDKLPERQRTALNLRIFEDLSFKEIADIMQCPYDTAKANYRHALLKLKARLEGDVALKSWTSAPSQFSLMDLATNSMEVD